MPCRRAMLTGRYTLPVKGWSQLDVSDTTIADLCWGQPIDSYLIHDSGPFRLPKFVLGGLRQGVLPARA